MPAAIGSDRMRRCVATVLLAAALQAGATRAALAEPPRWIAQRYDTAVSAFREGRIAAAYGHFVALAEAGYRPAARHALWMCEHAHELFQRPLDCAPHEIEDWARLGGVDATDVLGRIYPGLRAATPRDERTERR